LIATTFTADALTLGVLALGSLLLATYAFLVAKGRDPARMGPAPDATSTVPEALLAYLLGFALQLIGIQSGLQLFPEDRGLQYLLSYLGPIAIAAAAFQSRIRRRTVHGPRAKGALAGVLGWLAWFPVVFAVFTASQMLWSASGWTWDEQQVLEQLRTVEPWQFFLIAAVLAPVYEEVIFRGLLYPALRRRVPRGASILISAAIFAIVHWSPEQMPALFVLGLALAWLYERTGTLAAPIAFHASFNGFTFLSEMLTG
jgi:membrane protease YdiL (CAAX protease family)